MCQLILLLTGRMGRALMLRSADWGWTTVMRTQHARTHLTLISAHAIEDTREMARILVTERKSQDNWSMLLLPSVWASLRLHDSPNRLPDERPHQSGFALAFL